jgi:hypothetical protein
LHFRLLFWPLRLSPRLLRRRQVALKAQ